MPVSVAHPRRRAPATPHTVSGMREMAPDGQGDSGESPGARGRAPAATRGPSRALQQQQPRGPPPPPPPGWPPGGFGPPVGWPPQQPPGALVPPPSGPGYFPPPPGWWGGGAAEDSEDESQGTAPHPHRPSQRRGHHGHPHALGPWGPPHFPPPPPPPPQGCGFPPPPPFTQPQQQQWPPPMPWGPPPQGFEGMPPPPPGWGPAQPDAHREQTEEEEAQRVGLASPALVRRSLRAKQFRSSLCDWDEGVVDEDRLAELGRAIGSVRSTSPSRRQIARLQRLLGTAREAQVSRALQPQLSAEQQADLEQLQERHRRMVDSARRRQDLHQAEVAQLRQEQRAHPGARAARRSRSAGAFVGELRSDEQCGGRYTHTSVVARPGASPARLTPRGPRRGLDGQAATPGRHAAWVEAAHNRLSRTPGRSTVPPPDASAIGFATDGEGGEDEAEMLAMLATQGRTPSGRRRSAPVISPTRTPSGRRLGPSRSGGLAASTSRRGGPGRSARPAAPSARPGLPSERDYLEGVEDLHQKLRRTYLEIQRNPQRFLSQLATQGAVDPSAPSAAEALADLGRRDAPPPASLLSSRGPEPPSGRARAVRGQVEALEAQWDQLVAAERGGDDSGPAR
eukprot:TRINITY_DN26229_c0_g2_i1.p2 TRINITY_DN26229_c0_g2~~TRINITY_DN26229_c0_g2_i1.p2  ORF type:complete len:644 (+),score=115.11 TRINITY_DN26229_c0_g2_i1:66-1934(+)